VVVRPGVLHLVNHPSRDRFRPFLGTTRREGALASEVLPDVGRLSLNRSRTLDLGALRRLAAFVRENGISIVHAHSSSLFLSALLPGVRIVWHDHFGREEDRPAWLWGPPARRAAAVVAVSEDLARWSRERLRVEAIYLPNFIPEVLTGPVPNLPGTPGSRVVCVANLRAQKDHLTLLRAMARVDAHLLLAGADVEPAYAARVREEASALGDRVTFLGSRSDVPDLLRGCDVGVLSSASEGFPLSLLEYGRAGLAAVATRVGQCPEVLDEAGILVPPGDSGALAAALLTLLGDPARRKELGEQLCRRVRERYSAFAVMERLEAVYHMVLGAD
jgi:glycosyltransferase involved in cell wall biosynthesis